MSVFDELKRRNVYRVGTAYLIAAWLVLQIVEVTGPMLGLPDWIGPTVLLLLAVGFVVSIFVAWAYEVTPEGIKRERDVDRTRSITHSTGRKIDFVIIGVLIIALSLFAVDRFVWQAQDVDLEKSIAVIPFANRSTDEADENFVNGIHDDILTQLNNLSIFDRVISRTSVEQYRDTQKTVPEIAAELAVANILEGGVQRAGNDIRINVQLIDAGDEHLWAATFDRELTIENMFAIQSEIAIAIANELRGTLTDEDEENLAKLPTDSLEAWEKYQLGKYMMADRSVDKIAQGHNLLREAIELDPDFALAHVAFADSITLGLTYGWEYGGAPEEVAALQAEGRAAAERALEIDPGLGEAYTSLGYAEFYDAKPENLRKADAYFQEAFKLSPNYIELLRWYPQALWLYPLNQPEKALSLAERAVALDPVNPINRVVLGVAFEINGRPDEALASIEKARELQSTNVYATWEHVNHLRRHGHYSRAIAVGLQSQAWLPDHPRILQDITLAYLQIGDRDNFNVWYERTLRTGNSFYSYLLRAALAIDNEDFDAAVQHFESSLDDDFYDYWTVKQLLIFAKARSNQLADILALLEDTAPEFFERENPELAPQTLALIPAAALALRVAGEEEHAAELIESGLQLVGSAPRQAFFGYGIEIADIEMHVLNGDHQSALDTLAQAVTDGYRTPVWLDTSPFLDPIRSEPEFIAAMEVIREEMARQRAELEEMERNGELPPLPE